VDTRIAGTVIVPEANAHAALEVASRFAVDPRWLVHLPPTMSPSATSSRPDVLEHPDEALGLLPHERGRPRRLRGEAHGLARRDRDGARCERGAGALRGER
jgi:hypothetical protein